MVREGTASRSAFDALTSLQAQLSLPVSRQSETIRRWLCAAAADGRGGRIYRNAGF